MFITKLSLSTCFGHHYAHHQENKTVFYCVRVLPGRVGCGWLWSCGVASWAVCTQLTTPHAVGHGLILLMMGITMPETCWDRKFDNKHRISCVLLVLSLSSPYVHDSRSQDPKNIVEPGRPYMTIRRMPDTYGYKHTLTICNSYCFSTATTVSRTCCNVTL